MRALTITELVELLRECAGEDESVSLSGNVLDDTFADLGYDSLALLEMTGMIEREYSIKLSDESVLEADTPGKYLDLVNTNLLASS